MPHKYTVKKNKRKELNKMKHNIFIKVTSIIAITLVAIFSIWTIQACKENVPDIPTETTMAKAKTIRKSMCEGLYIIQIFEGEDIPQTTSNNSFYAINLPEEYKKPNLNININYRLPKTNEIPVCPSMEEGYTCIYIISIN